MKLSIELSATQAERLRQEAERLGLSPEELARAVVADILTAPDEDFQKAALRSMPSSMSRNGSCSTLPLVVSAELN